MPAITAKPITATPITARPLTAYGLGESADVSRWYLHWGGVNEYAVHSAWAMSGFGDRIEFSFVADDPGNQNQRVISGASVDGRHELFMLNATAVCYWVYRDTTGAYQAIVGPTAIAGTLYICTVSYNADGVIFTVNGTEYVNSAVPQLSAEFTNISSVVGGGGVLDGTIHYLRYVNATALQSTPSQTKRAVVGNGVDLYGVIPEITLTGDFEIEWDGIFQDGVSYGDYPIGNNTLHSMIALGNQTQLSRHVFIVNEDNSTAQYWTSALADIALGQRYKLKIVLTGTTAELFVDDVSKGTLTKSDNDYIFNRVWVGFENRKLSSGATVQNLKITDKSGAEDVVYQYDLSGDDGSNIPITINGVASTPGTWQNYDSGVDQVALPKLSRYYKIADGPNATHLADSWGADATGAELFNVAESDWDRSKT